MNNQNEELSLRLLQKLVSEFEFLELDMKKQLEIKFILDQELNNYDINTRCTSLVASDIDEKLGYYLTSKQLKGLSNKTIRNNIYFYRKLSSFIIKPVSTITVADLRLFLHQECAGNAATTLNSKVQLIQAFFQWLQDEEYIYHNPAKKLSTVKVPKRLREGLTIQEVLNLNEACRTLRDRALLELFISTGCRVGEVENITLSDIDFNEKTIRVIGKGNKQRIVFFDERCKFALNLYIAKERKGDSPYLFTTLKAPYVNLKSRGIQTVIDAIATRAGIDKQIKSVHPHKLRHTFAGFAINRGVDVVSLQNLMGHDSPSTTQKYFSVQLDTLKQEYKKMAF